MARLITYLEKWTWQRCAYVLTGILMITGAINDGVWFGIGLGIFVLAKGVLGLGCARGNCTKGNCY